MPKYTATISAKGQLVIPAAVRHQLNMSAGTKLSIQIDQNNNVVISKVPKVSDWEKLLANIPNEKVELDKKGHYDPEKSPEFDNWMRKG
uniref:AbrB/MazE/SpoVT family DNA-binding domain-containing protein n=1 Tax=Lentilactobacillus hilgardii TaxID=1588 RepID=UPI00403EFA1C